jgi:putative oxidoreductase
MAPTTYERTYERVGVAPAITMTILRVAVGVIMVAHGAQKLLDVDAWQANVDKLGMPMPATFALLAIAAEFLGGLGLIAGLLTRIAAFGAFCTMAVAIYLVHLPHGLMNSNNGFEYPLTLACTMLFFIASGAGPYSLDAWFGRMLHRRRDARVVASEPVLIDERPAIPAGRRLVHR